MQEWERSMELEASKLDAKKINLLSKILRSFKCKHPLSLPVLPEVASRLVESIGSSRKVATSLEMGTRREIADWCCSSIFRHFCMLTRFSPGLLVDCKIRNCAVGLLYLMRQGIIMHGVVLLPKIAQLRHILPLENHLPIIFGVRGKCITETENIVKSTLKGISRKELELCGVTGVDTKIRA